MKRGVPPTARKARTGELTPPGMTRWARSKGGRRWLVSVDTARTLPWSARGAGRLVGVFGGASGGPRPRRLSSPGGRPRRSGRARCCPCRGGSPRPGSGRGRPAPRRRRPAVRCRRPAARPARRPACRRRRRSGVEALELLARERALRRGQHVVDELLAALGWQHHAGDQHVARAVFAGGHRQLARRGRALAVPVGQQEVGQRLVVAHQHLGGRQDQLAEGVQVGLLLVFVEPDRLGR
jgi:hypothetical protein